MDRSNHYEAALEAYLRHHRMPYIAVDEARRSCPDEHGLKNPDFIVHGPCGSHLLVDVKGHRFPQGPPGRPRRGWPCWARRDDVDGLLRWQDEFGPGFQSLLAFVYHLTGGLEPLRFPGEFWTFRGRWYVLRAVAIDDYAPAMKQLSPSWQTVTLPARTYRELVRPFSYFTHALSPQRYEEVPF